MKSVESADVFDEDSRRAIPQAGSRAAHNLQLIRRTGQVGIISSHHEKTLTGFSRTQLTALASTRHGGRPMAAPASPDGRPGAVEYLHARATGANDEEPDRRAAR
ncbi:hypothetical protein [Streptomyces sp. NPDC005385]|uniref:hypothetical protein n=1 Tax=Streptomyces sp. NPDC005385 TaxID=3157039 RepID=UPI0033BD3459